MESNTALTALKKLADSTEPLSPVARSVLAIVNDIGDIAVQSCRFTILPESIVLATQYVEIDQDPTDPDAKTSGSFEAVFANTEQCIVESRLPGDANIDEDIPIDVTSMFSELRKVLIPPMTSDSV